MTSMQEILVIIVIGLLLFNWRKLPDIAGSFGKALTSFKRGLSEPDEVDVNAPKGAPDSKDSKDQDKNSGETPPKA
ncbi:twin-arginine translocase TatA/TatE family subunit [Humidesulfovibrio sp.]